jgi:antitoxin Phd
MSWQLQEAKQRFSELVRRAEREGPQVVTRHGEEVVVVVPAEGLEMIIPDRPKDDYPRGVDLGEEDLES